MQAQRFEAIVPQSGELQLKLSAFHPGESIEVIVLPLLRDTNSTNEFSLKDSVIKYDNPTAPVVVDDWSVLQ